MPELPEVETARRLIESHLVGRTVARIDVRLPKILRDSPIQDPGVFAGAQITGARRRAKVLSIDFSNGISLVMHFKLAGQWAILLPDGQRFVAGHPVPHPTGDYPHKSTHADLVFEDGTIVHYSDIRQFGWWRIVATDDVEQLFASFGFGPEGIGADLDAETLIAAMGRRGIPIKTLLLDQSFIAGLGNIYVDEVLFRAKVHPATPAKAVSKAKARLILDEIPWVLEQGIVQGGVKIVHSIAYPIDNFPAVHGREGEPCIRCGTTIVKTRVGARGTYLCPNCQRAPRKSKESTEQETPVTTS
jgi:formamidopyrimidine-DNA glycosylase